MAFCINCGARIYEAAKFCSACGGPVGTAATTPASASAHKSNSLLKILLSVAVVLVLLGCFGGGAAYYLFHRMAAKVADSTQGLPDVNTLSKALGGVDAAAPSATPSLGATASLDANRVITPQDGQCALFTKQELSKALGTDFTHADADATGCTYKGDAPREFVRTEATWTGGRKLVKAKADNYRQLRQSMVSQHYSKADIDSHVFPMMPYPGVGDEAWVNLWNVVTARKRDAGITMDLRYYHDSEDLSKALINTALSRLQDANTKSASESTLTTH